jgi:GWxTD domain-containing protein
MGTLRHSHQLIITVILGVLAVSFVTVAESQSDKSNASWNKFSGVDAVTLQSWLDDDVAYISSPAERLLASEFTTDQERAQFIEFFWQLRDPTPDTPENEFKEEHYRRIAYSNVNFGKTTPGWKTDRGKIYIIWGTPDKTTSDPDCVELSKVAEYISGGLQGCPAHEVWHYNYIEAVGNNQELVFLDVSNSGDYELIVDPAKRNAIWNPSDAAGVDESAFADEAARLKSSFLQLETPPAKSKELEEIITSGISRHELNFDCRSDSIRGTKFTTIVPITIEIPDREFPFHDENGMAIARINIFGRVTKVDGSVAETFESSIARKLPEMPQNSAKSQVPVCQHTALLRPGSYQLEIVVQDVASDRAGMMNAALRVSTFENSRATASDSCYFSATTNCSPIGGTCNTLDLNPAFANIF